ncbi:MAG TPA: radical SAM family heme chaperone HemW [Phycisphaerae bacterium]|nr:radical SAM family heme chaperone HemW [Phycisphaerae bacterium]
MSDLTVPDYESIGWYAHLPFCTTKCGYCDFYSLPTIPGLVDDLIAALTEELRQRRPNRPVESIFVGGGTPTVLPAEALGRFLRTLHASAGPVEEFTVEANPSSTDELKLELLRQCSVNRISFGAQSFNPDELRVLERIHDPRHIVESVKAARAAGLENINLDLIYGIPGQTVAGWRDTLARAIDLGTDHLSCYALMYEPGTSLTRLRREGRLIACDEGPETEMFDATIDRLTAAGFDHYEISNFARPGRRCRANIIYWENREYLGIGPSAVSYLDGVRRKNVADVRRYVEGMLSNADVIAEQETLAPLERAGETAIQMLRLIEGINFDRFRTLTGFDAQELFDEQMERFASLGLAGRSPTHFALSRKGLLVSNQIMQEFLAEPAASNSTR